MTRSSLAILLLAASASFVGTSACGGISDPTQGGEGVGRVTGALTGTNIPANAHVAVVWRNVQTGVPIVGADAPVIDGTFSFDLDVPPDEYFLQVDAESGSDSSSSPPQAASGGSSEDPKAAAFRPSVKPLDVVSGQTGAALYAALAGFIVYEDTNGNGALDLSSTYAVASDKILGGNEDLLLAYLRGGSNFDFELLADQNGRQPTRGFNLNWRGERWLSATSVELTLSSSTRLPSSVCVAYSGEDATPTYPSDAGVPSGSGGGSNVDAGAGYPDPSDPNLRCSEDGRSFSYTYPCSSTPMDTSPPGALCGPAFDDSAPSVGCGYGSTLPAGQDVPDGWPCPVTDLDGGVDADIDGGAAPDAGTEDGGAGE